MNRTTEFVLGLIGGIFGFFAAAFALFFGAVDQAITNDSTIMNLGFLSILTSITAIIGSVLVKSKAKAGGWLMLASGIVGIIAISLFYVLPGLLMIIGGLMGIFKKDKKSTHDQTG